MNDVGNAEDTDIYYDDDSEDDMKHDNHKIWKVIVISTLVLFIAINVSFIIAYSYMFGSSFDLQLISGYQYLTALFVIFLLSCCFYIFSSSFGIFTMWKSLKSESEDLETLNLLHYGLTAGFVLNALIYPVGIRILQGTMKCPCSKTSAPTCMSSNSTSLNCYLTPGKVPCPLVHKVKEALGVICVLQAMGFIVQLGLYIFRDSILGTERWSWKKLQIQMLQPNSNLVQP